MKFRKLPWATLITLIYLTMEGVLLLLGRYGYLNVGGQEAREGAFVFTLFIVTGFLITLGIVALALRLGRSMEEQQSQSSKNRLK
ncbi:MAG: hypothetical protein KY468_11395 [Armatimonadetes bacterium]|nr:hypothetical protein [Armatimonadota bacterium]